MITQKFEIRVALLGYVSVGKTTVLNALFRDKFSEVSMRRTTAGVNFFRIVTPEPPEEENNKGGDPGRMETNAPITGDRSDQWSVVADEATKKAEDVLKEIEASNKALRESGTNKIEEKWFNIELEQPLCEMRKDTSLVIVDVPGINESDSNRIYMNYVNENWKHFDCVVVVMDARQGVNTEEQLDLLKLIKKNLSSKKDVPVIILFNKVDEPDDSEQGLVVDEARDKIAQLFNVDCRETALKKVLEEVGTKEQLLATMYPVFIPTSAIHAFFFRTASLLTYEQFKEKFDMDLVDKMGRDEVGRYRWKKYSTEEKYQAVFNAVGEASNYKERLGTTNFDKFLYVLSLSIGGQKVQKRLLQKQLDVALDSLPRESESIANLRSIYDRGLTLGKDMEPIKKTFWWMYQSCKDKAFGAFRKECEVEKLVEPAELLWVYLSFVKSVAWKDEVRTIRENACKLVREQLGVVVNKQDLNRLVSEQLPARCSYCNKSTETAGTTQSNSPGWNALTYCDWLLIFESILLVSFNRIFCEEFGREKILLGQLKQKYANPMILCTCSNCDPQGYRRNSSASNVTRFCSVCNTIRTFCPHSASTCWKDPMNGWQLRSKSGQMESIVGSTKKEHITIPSSLADSKHWAHIAWKCCNLLEVTDKDKAMEV